ncbi:hypothetical protein RJT34_00319 [Clitoria ternatea]|uniref:Transcription termination factor MTERF6, chloroplastic/mitochondrial-like n=1 Tax=Clitoria ternatea TaxID=43366 RepID=A0AAN9KFM8_CLITE
MHHFLISRLTTRKPHFGVLCHNAILFFNSHNLSVYNTNHHRGDSFNVFTLINSCGLSPEKALKLTKRLHLKNPDGSNAVVDLLRNYGFSETQLCSLVKKHPFVLFSNPEQTLLPKLKFLRSIGLSTIDFPRILIGNLSLLKSSLNNVIIPCYEILRSLVLSDKEVVSTLKHGKWFFCQVRLINESVSNIEALRQLGLPQRSISLLVTNYPSVAFMKHSRFLEVVDTVEKMGFDPLRSKFVLALQVLAKMNKAMWKSRLEVYQRWGWSTDICIMAFKMYPPTMMLSEKKITKMMSFLVKDMGLHPLDIARLPLILSRSLEKIFIPRCAVIRVLKSRGLVKSDLHLSSFIMINEKMFLKRYMIPFQKSVPLLLDAYEGQKLNRSSG